MKAVIFDCFGVLITDIFDVLLQEVGVGDAQKSAELVNLVVAGNHGGLAPGEFHQRAAKLLGMEADQLARRLNSGEEKNVAVLEYGRSLRPHYKTAVLSNVSRDGFWRRFTHEEAGEYFDVAVLPGEIGYAKPEAKAYEITAGRLGVRLDECVMIDDREEYCAGAREVGMRALRYISLPQMKRELNKLLR